MKGLRDKKNLLKRVFYESKDHLIVKMEDEEISFGSAKEIFDKIVESLNEYFVVCNDLIAQWKVYR